MNSSTKSYILLVSGKNIRGKKYSRSAATSVSNPLRSPAGTKTQLATDPVQVGAQRRGLFVSDGAMSS